MDESAAEGSNGRGGPSTPSRISLTALCTPTGSPLPHTPKGGQESEITNGDATLAEESQQDVDVSMAEADGETSEQTNRDAGERGEGEGEQASDGDEGDEAGEEGEEEDDEDDDDDDEDDDEEDGGSGSESGTFQSVSETEGREGSQAKSPTKDDGGVMASSETALASSDGADTSMAGQSSSTANEAAAEGTDGAVKVTEAPKRKKPKRRSPSLDVSLPVGPPARPTMRLKLTIAHSDEEEYLTNVPEEIYRTLKEKGHPWADWYESTLPEPAETAAGPSEEPDLSELGGLAKLLAKYPDKATAGGAAGGKKKKKFDEYDIGQYNTKDPFVDDSELGVDEPTHSAKPSADGFFVTQGEVELQKGIAAARDLKSTLGSSTGGGKKAVIPVGFGQGVEGGGGAGEVSLQMGPNADSIAIINRLIAQHAVSFGVLSPAPKQDEGRQSYFSGESLSRGLGNPTDGSRQSPIKVDDEDGRHPLSQPQVAVVKYPIQPVSQRLEREFDMLRQRVAKESWLKKAKFPPNLREPLMQASRVAVALDEYNDNFFNWLPHIFPYNRLTLHKYTKRQFLGDHTDLMRRLQDLNLEVLNAQIKETLPMLQQEYDEAKATWANGADHAGVGAIAAEEARPAAAGDAAEISEMEVDEGDKGEEESASKGEPIKRWRWTETMREILFTVITIDNAITDLKNEKM